MEKENCLYDYANKCDCSEDDKCGCTYPNNMGPDFEYEDQNKSQNPWQAEMKASSTEQLVDKNDK